MNFRSLCAPFIPGLCLALNGCAYLTNYTQPINLRDGSVSIDVKQRVVFSQSRSEFDKSGNRIGAGTVVCAEPSPDALTVLGASGGLSLNNGTGKIGNASLALSESGASIGLRTQSIQLLRDAMYRLCEGYAAGAVSNSDFAAMQRRYQSTMMGLIAIEQLTGPIVAAQAMLTSSAASQGGISAGNAIVDGAQTKVDLASEAVFRAQTDSDGSQTVLDTTRTEIKTSNQKIAAEKAKKEPDQGSLDSLNERLASLATQEKTQQNDLADKKRRLDDAIKRREDAKAELMGAKAKVVASAASTGRLGDVAGATRDSNIAFAEAVRDIVTEINRSYSRDGCLTLMTELARTGSLSGAVASPTGSAEVQQAQQRVVELRGTSARLETEFMALREKLEPRPGVKPELVPSSVIAELREKLERAETELKYAIENLERAKGIAARSETAARAVDGTTVQAVEVCQSILAAEKSKSESVGKELKR